MIKTILANSSSELDVKKSKFIANIIKITDEQDAKEKLNQIRKEYSDARHNCYAYIVYDNETKTKIEKSSDDREPSGTAGIPMLTLLQKNNLVNVLIVVTRYFGGILLGTGGLVRAYTDSSKQALEAAKIIELQYGEILEYYIEYDEFEYFKYICEKNNIEIINTEYSNNIKAIIKLKEEDKSLFSTYKCRIIEKNAIL
ncbi:MAG: YigZ family protein [Clostridiales bacterium]|nr:YigZ family protein [Clostridiales bacterium]